MKIIGKVFILLTAIALILVPLAACQGQQEPSEPQGPEIVTFPDKNLEAAIRGVLGKPVDETITTAELAELIALWPESSDIADLSGLEYCTNLAGLYLFENQISDISPLENLTSLIGLILGENQISDITPLVENSGLGTGDEVWLEENNLDLGEGSEDMENIRALEDRGVVVHYLGAYAPD